MDSFDKAMGEYLKKEKPDTAPLVKKVAKIVGLMVKAKKSNDNKGLVKHHEALDKAIHEFVGSTGKTPEEKKKGI